MVSSNRSDGLYYVVFGPIAEQGEYQVTIFLATASGPRALAGSPYVVRIGFGARHSGSHAGCAPALIRWICHLTRPVPLQV